MPIDGHLGKQDESGNEKASLPGDGSNVYRRLSFETLIETPVRRMWHSILNLARWGILCALLAFLLSAVLTLHEALNFQDRVVELAGNDQDRARRVLGVLYDTVENRELYAEDRDLPFASIAVKLDRLRHAQRLLGGFTFPNSAREGSGEKAGSTGSNVEKDRQDGAASSQHVVKRNAAESVNGASGRAIDEPSDMDVPGSATGEDARQAFEAAHNRLKLSITDLEQAMQAGHAERRLVGAFYAIQEDLGMLKMFEGGPPAVDDDDMSSGSAIAGEHSDIVRTTNQYALQELTEELERHVANIRQDAGVMPEANLLIAHLETLKKDAAGLEGYYSADLKRGIPATPKGEVKQGDVALEDTIKMVSERVDGTHQALTRIDEGFAAATELAGLINSAGDLSNELSLLESKDVNFRPPLNGEEIQGSKAIATFDDVRSNLSKTIDEIEDQLDKRTRVLMVANQLKLQSLEDENGRNDRALAILRDFDSIGRFKSVLMPLASFPDTKIVGWFSGFGLDPQKISTLHRETLALIFVFIIGAIGSVIYITKYSIQLVLEGNWLTDRPKRSLAWYLFRPFFGVIVALAAFLLFKAGQLALGNSSVLDGSGSFNLPILSVIALFAGLLSWQALEAIETRGATWFRSQKRQYLWATGLEHSLREDQHSREELASSVGRSVDQIFRWLVYRDRVSPEMQDRIADWLEVPPNQLFRNEEPQRKPLWLRVAPDDPNGVERKVFEEELAGERFDKTKLECWLGQKKPVPPMAHDRIILALDRAMNQIFTDQQPKATTPQPPSSDNDSED